MSEPRKKRACRDNATVFALVRPAMVAQIEAVSNSHVDLLQSYKQLASTEELARVTAIVIDHAMLGPAELSGLYALIKRHPCVPFIGLAELAPANLRIIALLANEGLAAVFVYPLSQSEKKRFCELIETLPARKLAIEFLSVIEAAVGTLSPTLTAAVLDVFDRPKRYERATDIALQAEIVSRRLYRRFGSVCLGSPRKLLIAARMVHAYVYLRSGALTVEQVGERVGYQTLNTFVDHTREIFRCCPSELRFEANGQEVVKHLFEWYCKPKQLRAMRKSIVTEVPLLTSQISRSEVIPGVPQQ